MMPHYVADRHDTTRMLFVEADGQEFVVRGMPHIAMRYVTPWDALCSAMTLAEEERLTIVVATPETTFRLRPQRSS